MFGKTSLSKHSLTSILGYEDQSAKEVGMSRKKNVVYGINGNQACSCADVVYPANLPVFIVQLQFRRRNL
jgi:hypothetical protein